MRTFLATCISVSLLVIASSCATLPDTQFLTDRYHAETARLAKARGQIPTKPDPVTAAWLKKLDVPPDQSTMLSRQIVFEQHFVDSPLMAGNKVTLLQDGPATYKAMLSAISKAKDHINIEFYIIEDDEVGQKFAEHLLERQAHGVQVNLIYDSVGAINTPRAYFERLSKAGIKVLEFNPVNPLTVKRKKTWELNHRDHRKLLVVDGKIAFIGGINISSVYSSGSSIGSSKGKEDATDGWRDTHIQIEGPVVREFQKLFMLTWDKQRGEPLAQMDYFPELDPMGKQIVRAIGSSPDDPYNQIYLTFISAITNAEKSVYIANAYFVPDPQLIKALLDAAKRGVDVRLILPSFSDFAMVFHAGRSHYTELLEGGVKIYERRGAVLHVKAAIMDGVWSTVGSTNLDWRSALDNDEINAIILGADFAGQLNKAFQKDIKASDEIKLEAWNRRSPILRIKEQASRLWGRLL